MPKNLEDQASTLNELAQAFYEAARETFDVSEDPAAFKEWLAECDVDPYLNGVSMSYTLGVVAKWPWKKLFCLADVDAVSADLIDMDEIFFFLKQHEASIAKASAVLKSLRIKAEAYRNKIAVGKPQRSQPN